MSNMQIVILVWTILHIPLTSPNPTSPESSAQPYESVIVDHDTEKEVEIKLAWLSLLRIIDTALTPVCQLQEGEVFAHRKVLCLHTLFNLS